MKNTVCLKVLPLKQNSLSLDKSITSDSNTWSRSFNL